MTSFAQKRSMNIDSSQTSATMPLDKTTKVAIAIVLAVTFVCAVLAIEIELLDSGTLVVVVPE
jgi:hypothetical protein